MQSIASYFRNICRALLGADGVILTELSQIKQELHAMTASFDRLSSLVDQAVTKIGSPSSASGTSDADLDTLSVKLDAALNPPAAAETEPAIDPATGLPVAPTE